MVGDITFTLDPTAAGLQFGFSIEGDITFTLVGTAAGLDFQIHPQITGDISFTLIGNAAFGHHVQGDITWTLDPTASALHKTLHAGIQGIQIDTLIPAALMEFRQGAFIVGDIAFALAIDSTMGAHLGNEISPHPHRVASLQWGKPFIMGLPSVDGVIHTVDSAWAFHTYDIDLTTTAIVGDVAFTLIPAATMDFTTTVYLRAVLVRDKFTPTYLRM